MPIPWTEKYRPVTLDDLWQRDNAGLKFVQQSLHDGSLPQLILAIGEFGTGKTSLARAIGRRFLCHNPTDHPYNACGRCVGCREVTNTDGGTLIADGYIEFDASAHPPAHILRAIHDHVIFNRLATPADPRYRGWITCIDEVPQAGEKLQAMLAKFIENSTRARFILCYADPSKILPALQSRGVRVHLTPPSLDEASVALQKIASTEGVRLDDMVARFIAESMRCLPRACVNALEVAARLSDGGSITAEVAHSAVGLVGPS